VIEVGQKIPVNLPCEIVRAEVIEVMSGNEVRASLTVQAPMAKSHSYKIGDVVLCRRSSGLGGIDRWEAVGNG